MVLLAVLGEVVHTMLAAVTIWLMVGAEVSTTVWHDGRQQNPRRQSSV